MDPSHRAPGDTVNIARFESRDVDEQAALLSGWAEKYQQIGRGSFTGALHQVQIGALQIFSETTSQRVHELGAAWPGALVFALVRNTSEPLRWLGQFAGPGDVACFGGNQEFDIVVPGGSEILAVAVDSVDFQQYAPGVMTAGGWGPEGLPASPQLLHSADHYSRLATLVETTLQTAAAAPQLLESAQVQKSLRARLFDLLADLQEVGHSAAAALSPTRRSALVAAAREYAKAQGADVPSVADLCRHFGVSRRTLQYAFEEVTGMNPVAHLRALRLNGVRREIKTSDPDMLVMDIAARWGFRHSSYFTASYKGLFGEVPSKTQRTSGKSSAVENASR